ncbi:MAG: hypothetical protein G01um101429_700 [Parcubacteria group bacterium Gr01-1014_29]|nr:MAG: hypothetical protein G01um101429_700 [Parcubacteria group bacterium Gr01-1014_29]
MSQEHQSFFEKLTGSVPADSDEMLPEYPKAVATGNVLLEKDETAAKTNSDSDTDDSQKTDEWLEEVHSDEGQLTVDVYQTPTHVVVQAPMAGVKPDEVDVSINNDMITIRGKREHKKESESGDYYYRELYWGAFSRSILLPEEVDSDRAEASFKNGLLTIKMPKINKEGIKQVKIQTKEE